MVEVKKVYIVGIVIFLISWESDVVKTLKCIIFPESRYVNSNPVWLTFTVSQELTDYLHAGANSCKLKGRWKFYG